MDRTHSTVESNAINIKADQLLLNYFKETILNTPLADYIRNTLMKNYFDDKIRYRAGFVKHRNKCN